MSAPEHIKSSRFRVQAGHRVVVQVPQQDAARVLDAVLEQDALVYGDYDRVAFVTCPGVQQFRSLSGGRNSATEEAVTVPCVELSFFTDAEATRLELIISMIYHAHPYEEPVVHVMAAARALHLRGVDEDNPNRFWNRPDAGWVPKAHRFER